MTVATPNVCSAVGGEAYQERGLATERVMDTIMGLIQCALLGVRRHPVLRNVSGKMKKYVLFCGIGFLLLMAAIKFLERYVTFSWGSGIFILYSVPVVSSLFAAWIFVRKEQREPSKKEVMKYSFYSWIVVALIFWGIPNVEDVLLGGLDRLEASLNRIWKMHLGDYIVGYTVIFVIFYILLRLSFGLGAKFFIGLQKND